jgi:hypothetical protein
MRLLSRTTVCSLLGLVALSACGSPNNTPDGSSPDVVAPMDGHDTDAHEHDAMGPDAMESDAAAPPDAMEPDAMEPPADGGASEDWGFRPMPNGFSFENYTNMEMPTNLTPVEMRRLFGPQACEGAAAAGACTLVPQARQWMERINGEMAGGHCEGLAALSAHMYAGAISPMMFGGANAFALGFMGNESLQRELALWFSTQYTLRSLERRNLTPSQVVAELSRDLSRGRAFGGTVVGIYLRAGGGGHAITPYAIRRPNATTAEILTYDNNFPMLERVVTVDLAANTWRYQASTNPMAPASLYDGDATTFNLTLADVAPRLALPHPCAFCGDVAMDGGGTGAVQVSLRGAADLSISDGMGRTTGADAMGRPVNTIPGADVTRIRSGDLFQDSPEPLYNVPRVNPLTITLDGRRLTAMAPSELLITGPGWSLGVDGIALDPMQQDTVTVRPGAPDLTYRASGTETPTLSLAFQRADDDYLVELRSGSAVAGTTLRLAADLAMNRARLSFDGSATAPTFELYLERVSASGTVTFRHAGVAPTATSVLYVNYVAWAGDGMPLRVDVDTNNDGTIDRTDMLSDEP